MPSSPWPMSAEHLTPILTDIQKTRTVSMQKRSVFSCFRGTGMARAKHSIAAH